MAFSVPASKNYGKPLVSLPTRQTGLGATPPEGNRLIVLEIDWATDGGANNAVYVNVQNNSTLNFSQILTLSVDNSQCGSDIQFVFPDTQETTTIPAYSPKTIVPVFTNQTQFYVLAEGTIEGPDISRFSILNFTPPPIAVPTSQEQEVAQQSNVSIVAASGTQQLIPNTVSGTVEGFMVSVNANASAGNVGATSWTLKDGAGNTIGAGQGQYGPGTPTNMPLVTANGISVRFTSGVSFNWLSNEVGGVGLAEITIYYRSP